jgi:lipase
MELKSHRWGPAGPEAVVCLHGVTQHGRVFAPLGERLAAQGHAVVALDLRGHGGSPADPPWNVDTHADDVLETLTGLGIDRVTCLVGHSFGGSVAAAVAVKAEDRIGSVALLDAALWIPPQRALRSAEIERRDWSFETVDGGIRAVLSSDATVAPDPGLVRAFVEDDLQRGPDQRLRFSFSPAVVVAAWGEMVLPPPPVAAVPTLFIRPQTPLADAGGQCDRYREALGDRLTIVEVPNGHNVLWESPAETLGAIADFVGRPAPVAEAGAEGT